MNLEQYPMKNNPGTIQRSTKLLNISLRSVKQHSVWYETQSIFGFLLAGECALTNIAARASVFNGIRMDSTAR